MENLPEILACFATTFLPTLNLLDVTVATNIILLLLEKTINITK